MTDTSTSTPRVPGLLCVHAHPDDESMTTGGVLARYADEGLRTAVVTCTAGERGEIRLPGADGDALRPGLGELRTGELRQALELLGAGKPRLLGYGDSGYPAGNLPGMLWNAPFDELVGRLVAEIRAFRPDVVVTYDGYGLYGHPDHLQAHRATLAAVEAAHVAALYPDAGAPWRVRRLYLATIPLALVRRGIRMLAERDLPPLLGTPDAPVLGTPDDLVTTAVDVRKWVERKWAALNAHASQLGPGSIFRHLPEDLRDDALGTEWFIRRGDPRPPLPAAGWEDDLFAGVR